MLIVMNVRPVLAATVSATRALARRTGTAQGSATAHCQVVAEAIDAGGLLLSSAPDAFNCRMEAIAC